MHSQLAIHISSLQLTQAMPVCCLHICLVIKCIPSCCGARLSFGCMLLNTALLCNSLANTAWTNAALSLLAQHKARVGWKTYTDLKGHSLANTAWTNAALSLVARHATRVGWKTYTALPCDSLANTAWKFPCTSLLTANEPFLTLLARLVTLSLLRLISPFSSVYCSIPAANIVVRPQISFQLAVRQQSWSLCRCWSSS